MLNNENEERLAELKYRFIQDNEYDVVTELIELYEQKVNHLEYTITELKLTIEDREIIINGIGGSLDDAKRELQEQDVTRNIYRKEIVDAQNERDIYKRAMIRLLDDLIKINNITKIVDEYLKLTPEVNAPNT